jgi:CTP synthase (UTP-ammonia lyase)
LEDAYISVIKALQHAALACRHRLSLIVSSLIFSERFSTSPSPSIFFSPES